jgi:hypothetical protein
MGDVSDCQDSITLPDSVKKRVIPDLAREKCGQINAEVGCILF